MKICAHCQREFGQGKKAQRFCSRQCWWDARPSLQRTNFWEKVNKTEGCWEFGGDRDKHGYGRVDVFGRAVVLAHRYSWEVTHGAIPKGMCVLHRCDNPPCVRPDHLFLGTQKDNMQDAALKGRLRLPDTSGPNSRTAKLTAEQVVEVRTRYAKVSPELTITELARVYDMRRDTMSDILRGKTYKKVGGPFATIRVRQRTTKDRSAPDGISTKLCNPFR